MTEPHYSSYVLHTLQDWQLAVVDKIQIAYRGVICIVAAIFIGMTVLSKLLLIVTYFSDNSQWKNLIIIKSNIKIEAELRDMDVLYNISEISYNVLDSELVLKRSLNVQIWYYMYMRICVTPVTKFDQCAHILINQHLQHYRNCYHFLIHCQYWFR